MRARGSPAGRLDDDEAGAGIAELREVLAVPVGVGAAVVRTVLAHWRDDDPVRQPDRAEVDGREELGGQGVGLLLQKLGDRSLLSPPASSGGPTRWGWGAESRTAG